MTSTTQWTSIPGYEGWYEINTSGAIRRVSGTIRNAGSGPRTKPGRLLKPSVNNSGYQYVGLYKGSVKQYKRGVHVLVARTFIPNPEAKQTVNHKNGIKTDNRVENLEWATHSENSRHAYQTGLITPSRAAAKVTESQVVEIRAKYKAGGITQKQLGKEYGLHNSTVCSLISGRYWSHVA